MQYRNVESIEKEKEKFPKHSHNLYHLHFKLLWTTNKQVNLLHLVPTSEKEPYHIDRP